MQVSERFYNWRWGEEERERQQQYEYTAQMPKMKMHRTLFLKKMPILQRAPELLHFSLFAIGCANTAKLSFGELREQAPTRLASF
ncbi:MAG: hypothetical protein KBS77_08090, partial [Bacteroidales bacterium]|nr:hypothetical protein [Candidatus Colicola faecequi]